MNQEETVNAVRLRYRTCNYLFILGAIWLAVGGVIGVFHLASAVDAHNVVEVVGIGIFSVACAVCFAIYRCPICDRFLSRFRSRTDQCGNCGARLR
jgi:hypothetical protein